MNWNYGLHWNIDTVTAPYGEPLTLSETKLHLRIESSITDEDSHISALIAAARVYAETDGRRLVTQTMRLTMSRFPSGRFIVIHYWPVQSISSITYFDENGTEQTLAATKYRLGSLSGKPVVELDDDEVWPDIDTRIDAVKVTFLVGYRSEFTAATSDLLTLTSPAEPPINGRVVRVSSGTTLPAGLSANTDYYIIGAAGNTCKLSATSGGSAVDITDTGTGTHYIHGMIPPPTRAALKLLISHWNENREPFAVGTVGGRIPISVEALLDSGRVRYL